MSNQKENNLVFTRHVSTKPSQDGNKDITRIFLDAEQAAAVVQQLGQAIETAEDGVMITLMQGTNVNGKPFGMIGAQGLEAREKPQGGGQRAPQQKAYAPKVGGAQKAYSPKKPAFNAGR